MSIAKVWGMIRVDTLEGLVHCQENSGSSFSEEQIWQIVQNVTLGLKVLHENSIIHRSISVILLANLRLSPFSSEVTAASRLVTLALVGAARASSLGTKKLLDLARKLPSTATWTCVRQSSGSFRRAL